MKTRTRAQHAKTYRHLPPLLRTLREEAGLTQRDLGAILKKPQSWIQNCETGSRRLDITELIIWAQACEISPRIALNRLLKLMGIKV